jgi:hypothetical protein
LQPAKGGTMAKGGKTTAQQVLEKTKELVAEYAKVRAERLGAPRPRCCCSAQADGAVLSLHSARR